MSSTKTIKYTKFFKTYCLFLVAKIINLTEYLQLPSNHERSFTGVIHL